MNIKTNTEISDSWHLADYDRCKQVIKFHSQYNSLSVGDVLPDVFISVFRDALCDFRDYPRLQEMDLPEHCKKQLREIHAALNDWINKEMDKRITEAPETE